MPKGINIGSFRDRVSFETASAVSDGQGGQILTWSQEFASYAEVIEMSGDRAERFGQVNYNRAFKIRLRFRNEDTTNYETNYRIIYQGLVLTIHRILSNNESIVEILAYTTGK